MHTWCVYDFLKRTYLQLFHYFSAVADHIPKGLLLMGPWREVGQPFGHQTELVILYWILFLKLEIALLDFFSDQKGNICF